MSMNPSSARRALFHQMMFASLSGQQAAAAGGGGSFLTDPGLAIGYTAVTEAGAQTGTDDAAQAYTRGSSTGPDTNDPTYVSAAPAHDRFGTTGDNDNAIVYTGTTGNAALTHATGFGIYALIELDASDVTQNRMIYAKVNSGQGMIQFRVNAGQVELVVYHGGSSVDRTHYRMSGTLSSGVRYRVAAQYDPTAARASRATIWVNGVSQAYTVPTSTGADAAIVAQSLSSYYGFEPSFTALASMHKMAGLYLISGLLASKIATYDAERVSTLGW